MCVNYRPSRVQVVRELFSARADTLDDDMYRSEVWPGGAAPLIRQDSTGARVAELATFGLIPPWAKERKHARHCYNARSETAATKPSFRRAWHAGHFALVPMSRFFEPNYESGAAVRWSIARRDGADFAVGALWSFWRDPVSGEGVPSFSLLTLNADAHPVLRRFHAPADEKRSLFLVPPSEWDTWLAATPELARVMLTLPDADDLVGGGLNGHALS